VTIRVILFDVNGTLLGYEDPLGFQKRFAQACCDMGHPVTVEQVDAVFRRLVDRWATKKRQGFQRASNDDQYRTTMTGVYQQMLEGLTIPGNVESKASALYERFIIREGFMPLHSDVEDTLNRLRAAGLRLGVLSNFPSHLEDTLKQHGIHGHFDFFVISSLVGLEKPDPAIFELAIARAGVPRDRILYLGDDPDDDIQGAIAVGLAAILVDRHDRWPQMNFPRIKSLAELPAIVQAP
jgi:putative hydrolase of the HAD superfamily